MKFYVASSFQNKEIVRVVSEKLMNNGWYHTYDWTQNNRACSLEALQKIGTLEKQAVADSDVVIVILPGGKGSHIELGMAIAWQKKIFLYSPNFEAMDMETTSTFYHLPEVQICAGSVEELISNILISTTEF
jgi:ABC-type antimicrobial peptide transport system ATPase subunit